MPAFETDASESWKQYGAYAPDPNGGFTHTFALPLSTKVTSGTVEVTGYAYASGSPTITINFWTQNPITYNIHTQSHSFSGPVNGFVSHTFTLNSDQRDDINVGQWGYIGLGGTRDYHPFAAGVSASSYMQVDSVYGSFTCDYSTTNVPVAPADVTFDADWMASGGFPMQRKWLTLYMECSGHPALLQSLLTDGSGNASWTIRDTITTYLDGHNQSTITPGKAIYGVIQGNAQCLDTGSYTCNTVNWYLPNGTFLPGEVCYPGLFESGGGSCSIVTNLAVKVRVGAYCDGRRHFILNGVSVDFIGLFGTETHTTDASGDVELTAQDFTTIYDVAYTGLPACGALSGYAAWTQPQHADVGILDGGTPGDASLSTWQQTASGNSFCGNYTYAVITALVCASCGTLSSTRLAADSFDNNISVVWADSSNRLKVSHHRHPVSSEALADSAQGWDAAITLESANASDVGLVYLQNNRVYLCYDLSGAKKYRTNDLIGYAASSADWSASGTPNPALSRHSCSGRAFSTAWRFRATGNSGAGDIKFSWCGDRTGADWNAEVTAVAGTARGPYCGGAYLGNKMGCLYTNDADNKIYWIESTNRDTWGTPTDTTMTGTVASLLRDQKGVLVGLIWDSAGKKCRACRSRDRGATWEKDTSDISVLPSLDVPPVLVYVKHYIFAVYVVGDQPMFAYSIDSGVTWQ